MTAPTLRAPLAAAVLAALLACGQQPSKTAPPATATATAHEALTGEPLCAGPGVHDVHVALFRCDTCHPVGAAFGFDVAYTFPSGRTTTAGGTFVRDGSGVTCTVACHYPRDAAAQAVSWSTPGPLACTSCHATEALPATHPPVAANATRADCQACHVLDGHMGGPVVVRGHGPGWADPANPLHASEANANLASCSGCHGATLDGAAATTCATCHDEALPAGVASWKVNCVMCHGGDELPNGAPPKNTWGNEADAVRTGAHTIHLSTTRAPAMSCTTCHPTLPADVFTPGHLDGGTAEVHLSRAVTGQTAEWIRETATCTNTYCHAAIAPAPAAPPVWTATPTGGCDVCHGQPPATGHPPVGPELNGCAPCHPQTVAPDGTLIPPPAGLHLDGAVQGIGGHSEAFKTDTASAEFHAYEANGALASCTSCHGAELDGGSGPACASCHGADWKTACVMCHGGTQNATGAPPKATWRNTSPIAIGAHTSHVTAVHNLSPQYGCEYCHPTPATPLAAGHANGAVEVTGYTGQDAALAATIGSPGWGGTSCATSYCHASLPNGATQQPAWTSTATGNRACTACHGMPPQDGPMVGAYTAHVFHANRRMLDCVNCHNGFGRTWVDPSRHANGRRDVIVKGLVLTGGWQDCGGCHVLFPPDPPEELVEPPLE